MKNIKINMKINVTIRGVRGDVVKSIRSEIFP